MPFLLLLLLSLCDARPAACDQMMALECGARVVRSMTDVNFTVVYEPYDTGSCNAYISGPAHGYFFRPSANGGEFYRIRMQPQSSTDALIMVQYYNAASCFGSDTTYGDVCYGGGGFSFQPGAESVIDERAHDYQAMRNHGTSDRYTFVFVGSDAATASLAKGAYELSVDCWSPAPPAAIWPVLVLAALAAVLVLLAAACVPTSAAGDAARAAVVDAMRSVSGTVKMLWYVAIGLTMLAVVVGLIFSIWLAAMSWATDENGISVIYLSYFSDYGGMSLFLSLQCFFWSSAVALTVYYYRFGRIAVLPWAAILAVHFVVGFALIAGIISPPSSSHYYGWFVFGASLLGLCSVLGICTVTPKATPLSRSSHHSRRRRGTSSALERTSSSQK